MTAQSEKRLNKCGLFEEAPRRKPLESEQTTQWNNVLWKDETKVMFDENAQCCLAKTKHNSSAQTLHTNCQAR